MTTASTSTSSRPRLLDALAPRVPPGPPGRPRPWRLLILGCLAVAALSLLAPSQPTYDPWAWLIWGREIADLDLVTDGGPSWKPLPVLFTTPFSLLGDEVAPQLWLVVARAGGLLALAMAFRLAARFAGPVAGVIAALSLASADLFASFATRGSSEGLLVALSLWAVERHLDRRPRDTFLLGVGCALLRPEVWPYVALYGVWLVAAHPHEPLPWRTVTLVGGAGAAVALLWFVPEYIGSGDVFRAASRALEPVPGSPAQAAHPFLAVFTNSALALWPPAYVGGVMAVLLALRRDVDARQRVVVLLLAAAATVLMITVAILAEIGFTGNIRYVALPASIVCVLAGVGWANLFRLVRPRIGARASVAVTALLLLAAAPFATRTATRTADQFGGVREQARIAADLPVVVQRAGGEDAVKRCGSVKTQPLDRPLVAWHLHLHQREVGDFPTPPATLLARGGRLADEPGFATIATSDEWLVRSSCGA